MCQLTSNPGLAAALTPLWLCRFYFAYCEAAFDARYLHNFQILWEKSSEPDAAATSRAPMGPSELPKQAVPPLQPPPSDPTTQVVRWERAPSPCGSHA